MPACREYGFERVPVGDSRQHDGRAACCLENLVHEISKQRGIVSADRREAERLVGNLFTRPWQGWETPGGEDVRQGAEQMEEPRVADHPVLAIGLLIP
jgi:hypothetical protein